MSLKQEARLLAIKTALGPDVLAVRSITLQEEISRLFQIEAELVSEDGSLDLDKVVGHDATVRMFVGQKDKRFFNGIVSRMVQESNRDGFARYRATIVPWLWLLTRTSDCRIFQEKTIPDIIEEVFKKYGFSNYQLKLSGNYPKQEYCVQYRETAFNFVSRLMEHEGIYYFFKHEDGKHTLILADSISAHAAYPGYGEINFSPIEKGAATREVITGWSVEKELQPVSTALQDFDFKKPKATLLSKAKASRTYGKAEYEIYDYPGEYVEHSEGDRFADARLNEIQTQYEVLHGEASARGLVAGCTFKLKSHPRKDQNREYLITGAQIRADAGEFAGGGKTGGEGEAYSCAFSAIDKAQQFRPARLTPKPIVQGPQTATVVGKSGEEVDPDEYGRVKVQFPWDRQKDSSCLIRVSQGWAGGKLRSGSADWGDMSIPHLGDEVVVEFLEGDPDRPLITGRVYNGQNKPPKPLPANKHVRIFRDNYGNEIVMDATPGSEGLHLYSPRAVTVRQGAGAGTPVSAAGGGGDEKKEGKKDEGKWEFLSGSTNEIILGAKNELIFGLKQDHVIGTAVDVRIGGCLGLSAGVKAEISSSQIWEHGVETNLLSSHEDQIISAHDMVSVVGGAGKDTSSLINADDEGVRISVGGKNEIKDPAPPGLVKAIMAGMPVALAIAAAATSQKPDVVKEQHLSTPAMIGIGAGNVATLVAYGVLWGVLKAKMKPLHGHENDKPKGRIEINKEGQITVNSVEEGVLITTDEKDKKNKKSSIEIKKAGDIELRNKDGSEKLAITDGYIDMVAEKRILIKAKGGDIQLLGDKTVEIMTKKLSSNAEIDFPNFHVDK